MKFSVTALALASALGLPADAQAQGQVEADHEEQKQLVAIPARQPEMVLVSSVLYTSVYGPNGAIGVIEDILINSNGKIEGLVVSVDGLLELEEKSVALPMHQFNVTPEADGGARINVSATEDELRNAPEFDTNEGQAS
jgi:hypothetical protein